MSQTTYNADKYLTSAIRALSDYIHNAFDADLVQVISEFPPPDSWETPLAKVVVHLELDGDEARPVGFGNGGFTRMTYDALATKTSWEEATAWHRLNFDVGVWAFQEAGGSTARMEAQEKLGQLFNGPTALQEASTTMEGVRVVSFLGGRHFTDTINGQPVWRAMDMALIVEVCGRRTFVADDAVTGFEQDPDLVIDVDDALVTP